MKEVIAIVSELLNQQGVTFTKVTARESDSRWFVEATLREDMFVSQKRVKELGKIMHKADEHIGYKITDFGLNVERDGTFVLQMFYYIDLEKMK